MTAATKQSLISVDDYLAGEQLSPVKHEYVGGVVYPMAGATNQHAIITMNVLVDLSIRLKGSPCRVFNSDTKVRIRLPGQTRFYYPDAMVVRHPNDRRQTYQDEPVVLIEVLSASTRRLDLGEKKDAYVAISSLQVYVLIEQQSPAVVAFRRTDEGFVREVFEGQDATIPLPEIGCELPLATVYDSVTFESELEGEES